MKTKSPDKKKLKGLYTRGFIWYVGAILIIGILGFLCLSKIKSTGWQTYRSDDGSFTFQLPSNWYMEKFIAKEKNSFTFSNIQNSNGEKLSVNQVEGNIIIDPVGLRTPASNYNDLAAENEFYNINPKTTMWLNQSITTPKLLYVGNKKAIYTVTTGYNQGEDNPTTIIAQYHIYLNNGQGQLIIQINYDDHDPNKSIDLKTISQILSTFKFSQ